MITNQLVWQSSAKLCIVELINTVLRVWAVYYKLSVKYKPLQLACLSCSATSVRLLKFGARMTFLSCGVLAICFSSFRRTPLPIPTAITVVELLPTVKSFSFSASIYNDELQNEIRNITRHYIGLQIRLLILPVLFIDMYGQVQFCF